jgi:hypothetical protein
MKALTALPLLLLAFVPAVAADLDAPAAQPGPNPLRCLMGPHIPETPLYYIVWYCTLGLYGVPEPIYFLTGCKMGFPAYNIQCPFYPPVDTSSPA